MKKLTCLFLLLLVLLLAGCQKTCTAHVDADDNGLCDSCNVSVVVVIDFYSINDLHGKFLDADTQPGVDELTTFLKYAQMTEDHVVLLSAGDMWQGSSESNMTQGLLMTDWMNRLGFAGMALGNHEFDWGEEKIQINAQAAQFPLLAINVYDRDTGARADYCDASVMVEKGGVQIGIIGAVGDCYSSIASDKTQGVYFKTGADLTALVMEESRKLREQGADFIVYTIHDGYGQSKSGVTPVAGTALKSYYDIQLSDGYVDLVFEGHTHQGYLLQDQFGVYHLQNRGDNKGGISHAEVHINTVTDTTRVQEPELIQHEQYTHLQDDPMIQDLLEKYEDQIAPAWEVVGKIDSRLHRDQLRQLVAQLYYEKALEAWGSQYDIVLGGGYLSVRSPGYLPAGEVTYSQLQMLFPFDNELMLCSIKGSDLKERFFETSNSDYFLAYGAYGQQVKDNLDPNATYYIVVDSYSSSYAPNRLTEIASLGPGLYARDLLAVYLKNQTK